MDSSVLDQIYEKLNRSLFNNTLPKTVYFLVDLSRKLILHFRSPSTIELGSRFSDAKLREVLEEFVHVMVHMQNDSRGVVDHTANQYHNKVFCETALEKGLYVAWHQSRGWAVTSSKAPHTGSKVQFPSKVNQSRLKGSLTGIKNLLPKLTNLQSEIVSLIDHKPQKQFQLKYVCDCKPPVIIRSGRRPDGPHPLDVRCNICSTNFVLDD